jgi:hypothetical protein
MRYIVGIDASENRSSILTVDGTFLIARSLLEPLVKETVSLILDESTTRLVLTGAYLLGRRMIRCLKQ